MALVTRTSFLSALRTMMCQCLERRCCQEVLNLFFSWNKVLLMTSQYSDHFNLWQGVQGGKEEFLELSVCLQWWGICTDEGWHDGCW